jgi:hypothetical protein
MAGVLIIKPLSAKLTRDTEFFGKMDPYCVARLGRTTQKTAVAKKAGKLPFWRDQLVFRKKTEEEVVFEVWDADTATADDLVGEARIMLRVIGTEPWEDWLTLKYRGRTAGKLRVYMEFTPELPSTRSSGSSHTPAKLPSNVGQEEEKRPARVNTAPDSKKRQSRGNADQEEEKRSARAATAPDNKRPSRGSADQEEEKRPTRPRTGQDEDRRRTKRSAEQDEQKRPSAVVTSQEKSKPTREIVSPEAEKRPSRVEQDKDRRSSRRQVDQDDGHTQPSRMTAPKPPVKSRDPPKSPSPPPLPFYLQSRPTQEVATNSETEIQASLDSDNSNSPSPIKSKPLPWSSLLADVLTTKARSL